ncbi:MAG: BamA/TamA family outer membrane protein [Bacteriovorax sp.]
MRLLLTILLLSLFGILPIGQVAFAEIAPAKNAKLKSIEWVTTPEMKKRFNSYFHDLIGKPWDILTFKIKVDQISKELFFSGYFTSVIKSEIGGTENAVVARLVIDIKDRINFQFIGNTVFSHQQLRSKMLDKIKNDFGKIDRGGLGNFINEAYEEVGFYNTSVQSYENEGKDLEGVTVKNYFFVIDEGDKLKVTSILYRGNIILSAADLEELFKKNATSLASAGYFDKAFFDNFSNIIKKEYLSRGFVFADVSKPRVVSNDEDDSLSIEYGISEKQQVILKSITLNHIDENLQQEIKQYLTNKEGSPLNVVDLENDLRKIIVQFQDKGYYFANISNLNDDSLLIYDKSFTFVDLKPNMVLDRQICFNEAEISGNIKTRPAVILREINIEKGELITPAKLDKIRQHLSNLGLFSTLSISPYILPRSDEGKSCAQTNLKVQVKEKDFGQGEIAPGYRTDLGYKFSTGLSYNNLRGMNESISFRAQGNLRTNLDGFDQGRRNINKKLLEYSTKVTFLEPYVFHDFLKTQLEFEFSTSFQRKRFVSFDADIFRISPQISKTFKQYISTAIRYQFERINQFYATSAVNNDNYSIGGVTPSITFDRRDDPINPKKGTYFSLSSEWANPYFLSMKNQDLEVNYVKVVSRNKFYVPVGNFVMAVSLAMGYQKNFAEDVLINPATGQPLLNANGVPRTHGYIPSIKVFRLDGYDEIRGYDEGEINRIRSGQAVGDVVVQNEAYFTAFKFEPRYNVTDTVQLGVFFDAGRVFVNDYKPFDLRTSVGAGVKFLTPVGSLDFDYGFKLQRKTYPDTSTDSVGRFHLSIGYF